MCRAEFQQLVNLRKKLKDQGVGILGVNVKDPRDKVSAFVKETCIDPLQVPIVLDSGSVPSLSKVVDVRAVPVTLLVDSKGRIIKDLRVSNIDLLIQALKEVGFVIEK